MVTFSPEIPDEASIGDAGHIADHNAITAALNTLNDGKVDDTRAVNTEAGLSGGGDLTADLTLSIAEAGVDTLQLADDAVTSSKIADEAVIASKIASGSIVDAAVSESAALAVSKLAELPYSVDVAGHVIPAASSTTSTVEAVSGIYAAQASAGSSQNNYLEWSVWLAAGTYTLRVISGENDDHGIISISIDGGTALATTIDGYAGTAGLDTITDIADIELTAGRHTVRFTSSTKNEDATAYIIGLQGFSLTRTGALPEPE